MFICETGKVDFHKLKYSLNELFHHTPVFDVPPIDFEFEDDRDLVDDTIDANYMSDFNRTISESTTSVLLFWFYQ